jgi:GNAT superfamily N-acetyltransferase
VTAEVKIRPFQRGEGARLREVAVEAKVHWGYDRGLVEEWVGGGDFSDDALLARNAFVAEQAGRIVAWGAAFLNGSRMWLDDLWVMPDAMGRGIGRALFGRALDMAREQGAAALEWEAELHAVGFYRRLGGRYVRDTEPGLFGPSGPVMAIELGGQDHGDSGH